MPLGKLRLPARHALNALPGGLGGRPQDLEDLEELPNLHSTSHSLRFCVQQILRSRFSSCCDSTTAIGLALIPIVLCRLPLEPM